MNDFTTEKAVALSDDITSPFRYKDRKQIGVQQGRRNLVGEPPQLL
jgi:hypothetical protein